MNLTLSPQCPQLPKFGPDRALSPSPETLDCFTLPRDCCYEHLSSSRLENYLGGAGGYQ